MATERLSMSGLAAHMEAIREAHVASTQDQSLQSTSTDIVETSDLQSQDSRLSWVHKIPHGPRTKAAAAAFATVALLGAVGVEVFRSEQHSTPPSSQPGITAPDGFHAAINPAAAGADLETATQMLQDSVPVQVNNADGSSSTMHVTKDPVGSQPQK